MTATGVPFRPGFPAWLVVNEPGSAARGGATTAVTEDRSYADGVLVKLPVAEEWELLPDLLMPSGVLRTGPLAGCDLTAHTDRPNRTDGRPLYVRGQRNMTVHSVTRRPTMGPSRNAPPAREFAASGAFSQGVAGVGFEPT
jgi:hypothetical protein